MLHSRELLRDFSGFGPRLAWWLAFAVPLAVAAWRNGWHRWHGWFFVMLGAVLVAHVALRVAFEALRWPRPFHRVVPWMLGGALLGGLVSTALVRSIDQTISAGVGWWLQNVAVGAAFALLLVGPPVLARRAEQVRRRATQEAHERELARQTQLRQVAQLELKALQAQIEPHFLYNTLANVQHLLRNDPAGADRMLDSLIRYLKCSLPQIRAPHSTVGEEIARIEAYLAIMQVRMQSRLRYAIDVPAELHAVALPPLSLLTLVENAVKHGLEPRPGGGTIRIGGVREADTVELCVADDGNGFTAETGGGVGLTNLRERLLALHGDAATLDLSQGEHGGVEARVRVPCPATAHA